MRIYISGKMTGCPDLNRAAFDAAAKQLREQGHFVINPAELSAMFGTHGEIEKGFANLYGLQCCKNLPPFGTPPAVCEKIAQSIMDADLAAVRSCDAIYLLRGWENSCGAKKELAEIIKYGLKIIQEGGEG